LLYWLIVFHRTYLKRVLTLFKMVSGYLSNRLGYSYLNSIVFDAIEGMRVALGPGVVLSYVLQGLFHPSRRVREVYWRFVMPSDWCMFDTKVTFDRIYNSLYLGAQDSLVPFYPTIELSDDKNYYEKDVLKLIL
jgi:splicing factor 3B subunit 1